MALLKVKNLQVQFETDHMLVHAVDDVSFEIEKGIKIGFVGESGSGKTTTALALMGMIKAPGKITGGSALLNGEEVLHLPAEKQADVRLREISYIPQGAMNSLNPVMKVRDAIVDGMIDHGVKMSKNEYTEYAKDLMVQVGLPPETINRYPNELSGGMKQRVCIAIAICMKPKLLIADEPTSALDVITQRQVMETLDKVQSDIGSALILIGHDMGLMAQFVDKLMVMHDGKIVESGDVKKTFKNAKHDYTKLLITSVPTIGNKLASSEVVSDEVTVSKNNPPLLKFDNVSKVYGKSLFSEGNTALHPVSLEISADKPRIISVVGQSGSGKTTMGSLMLGFIPPTTGHVEFQGSPINKLDRAGHKEFRRDVQAVFQDPYASFNPFYEVDHALMVPLQKFGLASSRDEAYAKMEEAVQSVGLDPRAILGRYAHQLSGGQRQRLMVARALMLHPKLIVADEPVSMVDASLRASILQNLQQLKDEHGINVIYITHDLATAYHVSDYVFVLYEGRVAEAGRPDDVIRSPKHPYTQVLVDSIPWPDPDLHWGSGDKIADDIARLNELPKDTPPIIRSQLDGLQFQSH